MSALPIFKIADAAASKLDAAMAAEAQEQVRDRPTALKRARALLAPSTTREAPPYPVAALGPLADACEAVAHAGQVQPALAGQCLLGAASLLTQGLFNVESLSGRKPLSLYLITLADSGDGKSTAQAVALAPVTSWQRKEAKAYAAALADYEVAKRSRKKDDDTPVKLPDCPFRVVEDATVEGLRRELPNGPCSQGVFSDEAAAILTGYGMSADHRAKTAAVFSRLWDQGHLSVSRSTSGRVERYGLRLAQHWLIQPTAAAEAVGDQMLAQLGFWPRFIVAWPAPLEPRLARPFMPETLPAVQSYWARCRALLDEQLPDDVTDAPAILMSDEAGTLLGHAFERFEIASRRGELRIVKPFGLRAAEQVCRVAGVLAAFAGKHVIDVETARHALQLVSYSIETWRTLIDEGSADPGSATALRLYEWLTRQEDWRCRLAVILSNGPGAARTKAKRDAALDVLVEHKLVDVAGGEARALMLQEITA
jgi:hypothetical protein